MQANAFINRLDINDPFNSPIISSRMSTTKQNNVQAWPLVDVTSGGRSIGDDFQEGGELGPEDEDPDEVFNDMEEDER